MLEISGSNEEIKKIKSTLWCSSDCPVCKNPEKECFKFSATELRDKDGCSIDEFYNCIEERIKFNII